MKCTAVNEGLFPPRRELPTALKPDTMNSIAGAIHILAPRPFKAENAVELLCRQFALDGIREPARPGCA
jgi:hypothetical protein